MTTIDTHATSAAAPVGAGLAGVTDWVTSTDHKKIGRLYLGVAALAAIGSIAIAALLAFERVDTTTVALPIDSITQLFSLYRFGLTYVVLLPALLGIAVAVVPLQVGARSIAFPRLAAAGFWTWLVGSVLAIVAISANGGPNGGNKVFVDLFLLAAVMAIAGLLASVVSVATTVLTTRAPGMNMRRVPWFTWSALVSSIGLLVALPMVAGNLFVLFLGHRYPSLSELSGNRTVNEWAGFGFTQPVTILMVIPAFGFLGEAVATSLRRRVTPRGTIFGAVALMVAAVYGAAVQHPVDIRAGFSGLSGGDKVSDLLPFLLVQVLPLLGAFLAVALTAQALKHKPAVSTALVFALLGSLVALLGVAANVIDHIGDAGLAGTTFEEGAWLAVVYGGIIAALGAVAHWGPKWWGRALPMKATLPLGLLAAAGAVLASVPMMIAGFADQLFGGPFPVVEPGVDGAVKFTYSGSPELWNVLSFAGHVVMGVAVLAFLALAVRAFLTGERAGDDPFDGQTLEWATPSPAPTHNFAAIHVVQSAEPLLDLKSSNRSDA